MANVGHVTDASDSGSQHAARYGQNERSKKLGAKNWLHIGHPKAGWRSAVIYSIVGTCRLLKVDPLAYLSWVLPKLAAATNQTCEGLLPHDYAALHPPQGLRVLNTS